MLAALVLCSLKSLRYHGTRDGVDVRSASGSARTLVTKGNREGRYLMVETTVDLAVELEPDLGRTQLSDLLEFAEHDCFVGNSLETQPEYRWTVNGRKIGW